MGSSHCGEVGLGKGRSSTSSSSRKGKSSSKTSLEKPKQPQRGLGVAQLEKIRLHNQFMANYNHLHNPLQSSFHHNIKQWKKRRHDRSLSTGSMSQNSDNSSGSQELDLELRLSL
ncbi:hypothetical protein IHE45_05G104900 [Dioscorea alata]|uniref:Uncharacterized protein n=1 Tax=Dioscorea alata TaxID=55571 RepID=A0ACB7W461_DIOAL|nr:hypothetical protein IHE45_05G104900 [Dioscorea alata]